MKHKKLITGAVVMAFLLVAASFVFAEGQATKTKSKTDFIGLDTKTVTNTWEAYFQDSFEWYSKDMGYKYIANEAGGDPAKQVTQGRQMIQRGINGLIVSAQDKDAAVPIVKQADKSNIPVFTADADINSPDVKMYVGFSGSRAGAELGQKIAEYLKSKYNGEVKGTVLEMMGPLGGASAQDRSNGFHSVIDQYKNVKILKVEGEFQEAPGKTAAENTLRSNPNIDAIYSANGPMAVGAVEAMKDLGMDASKVYTVTIDAVPGVIKMIKSGQIDAALDQPAGFYVPIAEYYLVKYLKDGNKALPKEGETITAKDLNLNTNVKHVGIYPWADNAAWAPAKITKEYGHLWFQTAAVMVTKDNADAPYLWANVKIPGY
jgi:ribose transport system substrate-binding protein